MRVALDKDGWPLDMAAHVAAEQASVAKAAIFPSPAGKARIAGRLVGMLPAHKTYVESFAGAASVFFAKDAAPVEVLNDLDEDIAEAYRTIQRLTPEQMRRLAAMEWTGDRDHFFRTFHSAPTDPIERLYRFLYVARFSFGSFRRPGFDPGRAGQTATTMALIERNLPRLKKARIFSGDYQKVVDRYDGSDTAHFFDPPYAGFGAAVKEADFDEERFFDVLKGLEGRWLLTYGFRGQLAKMLRGHAGVTLKTIRPERTIRSPVETGPRRRMTTLIATNYDVPTVQKALDAFEGDGWIVKEFDLDEDAAAEEAEAAEVEAETAAASTVDDTVPELRADGGAGVAKSAVVLEFTIHRVAKAGTERAAGADEQPHEVFGEVLIPDEVDAQGDIYSAEEVEAACRRFNAKIAEHGQADHAGRQHKTRLTLKGVRIIESYIAPADMVIEGRSVKKGTWLMRWEILDPALWADIEAGRVTGFSIGGTAIKTPIAEAA